VLTATEQEQIKRIFSHYDTVRAVYLFGSHATCKQTARSDIDLGVLLEPGYNNMLKLDILTHLAAESFDRVDLVLLNEADLLTRFEVVKRNKLIYHDGTFNHPAFFSRVVREYLDFKPFYRVQRKYLKEKLRHEK